jgi:serine/threonine-protein kinase
MPRSLQERADALLAQALERPRAEREAFLRAACAGDAGLLALVRDLLEAGERDDGFLTPGGPWRGPLGRALSEGLLDPPAAEGERVGAYRIVRPLGRGGMAAVYLAERADRLYEQRVALKVLAAGAGLAEVSGRFEQERQILASLDHPNIARLLDGGFTEQGRPFLAMEYVDGRPIDAWCDARRLTIDERLWLFLHVCRAVEHAHRSLVVHRDLKPSNIFVSDDGRVKLLDFGIAKILDPAAFSHRAPPTRTAVRVMTPEYASPEQVRGEPITTASDVYQLGLLLYELLTGRRAHGVRGAASAAEVERAVSEIEPRRPSAQVGGPEQPAAGPDPGPAPDRPATPEVLSRARRTTPERLRRRLAGDLDNIVLMALRKEPARRYASAAALAEDVERHLRGLPVAARRPTLGYRARKFARRHRAGVVAGSLAVLSLLAGFAATAWQARVAARERDRARAEAETARQVSEFLIGTFRLLDPEEARGRSVTALELLESGASRIDDELRGQPEVQARMKDVMGRVYLSLGLYDQAHALLSAALGMRREIHAGPHPDVAASLDNLGQVLQAMGRYHEAEERYRAGLEMRRALSGGANAEVAASLRNVAVIRQYRGAPGEAKAGFEQVLAMRRAVHGQAHPDVAQSLRDLAQAQQALGEYAGAAALLEEALAMQRGLLPAGDPGVADTLNALGMARHNLGDLDEAERLHREALDLRRRIYGPDHPDSVQSLQNLGAALYDRQDYEAAEAIAREVLGLYRRRLGDGHPRVATSMTNLAVILMTRGDLAAAEPLYREALQIRRGAYGDRHRAVGDSANYLGRLLFLQGRLAEAERSLREALAIYRGGARPDGDPILVSLQIDLGQVLVEAGRLEEAGPLVEEGLARSIEIHGDGHWRTADARSARGAWHLARGDLAAAEADLARAWEVLRDRPAGDARRRKAADRLAALQAALGRPGGEAAGGG